MVVSKEVVQPLAERFPFDRHQVVEDDDAGVGDEDHGFWELLADQVARQDQEFLGKELILEVDGGDLENIFGIPFHILHM